MRVWPNTNKHTTSLGNPAGKASTHLVEGNDGVDDARERHLCPDEVQVVIGEAIAGTEELDDGL